MKAVIFAAGKGTRMGEASNHTPKPMQMLLGKTLMEHKLDILPDQFDEVIIVVGHLKEKIMDRFGSEYMRLGNASPIRITYVIQDEARGTADALWCCKDALMQDDVSADANGANVGRFLVMMGDDIYDQQSIIDCASYDCSMLLRQMDSIKGLAKIVFDENGCITDILEKWQTDEPGFVCAGMYSLTPAIFDCEMYKLPNGEFGLPQTIMTLSKTKGVCVQAVKAQNWLSISSLEDIKAAEEAINGRA